MIIAAYLIAIVSANMIVAHFGPSVSVLTAFLFIGLNLTARDALHDAWRGRRLKIKMAALIAGGSVLSWILNKDAGSIALASAVSFGISELADSGVYEKLKRYNWFRRVTSSNIAGALIDSILFPLLAFGGVMPWITIGQFVAKVFGGGLWALALRHRFSAAVALVLLLPSTAEAQRVSVGFGQFQNEFVRQSVAELAIFGPAGVSVISSWNIEGDGKPVVLAQIGRPVFTGFPVLASVDIGVSLFPWTDYGDPEPHISTTVLAFFTDRWKAVTLITTQPFADWERAVLVKLDYTLWSR
jgi:hypothetical protein